MRSRAAVAIIIGLVIAALPSVGMGMTTSTATTVTPLSAFAQAGPITSDNNNTTNSNTSNVTTAMPQLNGSINVKQAAKDFLNQHINATLVDATDLAEEQVTNGTVVAGSLDAVQDSLVYNITVADLNSELAYKVYVDPSTGRVLARSTEGRPLVELGAAAGNVTTFGNLTITLVDAANLAENQIPNGIAIAGEIEGSEGGNVGVVYSITVADVNGGTLYKMTVDPNTSAVSTPQMMPMGNLAIGGVF
ncbi:Peptidase propeptide domain-containing protein [Candidatus Nitrososphaera evergladensis SR1]|uniref:Peptidase propeptide domain-containing protein n=2 Tax=Nitrososphaera TaxID=497726 RepID=A0A075N251_9ARCH|nr:Peptidase propeptide domain-containing protein [Candidatus Nitrososphaera evergladensis SR1]